MAGTVGNILILGMALEAYALKKRLSPSLVPILFFLRFHIFVLLFVKKKLSEVTVSILYRFAVLKETDIQKL